MTRQDLIKVALPKAPGVYLFKKRGTVLYVGKATSLKDRVRSYFGQEVSETRGQRIVSMVALATHIEYKQTDSVLEALILEADLIKRYQPKYNIDAKDDKSWNFVVITKEEYPRVLVVRGKDLPFFDTPVQFEAGPFPHSGELREALKIIRKIFPYRDTCDPLQNTPCFNAQIGLCPGVCSGTLSPRDYARTITHLKLFFKGKKGDLLARLEQQMKRYAKAEQFEEAARVRNQMFALTHVRDVSLLKRAGSLSGIRMEAYDVSHISGTSTVGVMVAMRGGILQKSEYRTFTLHKQGNNDVASLREILTRRLAHSEWPYPDVIVVDGGLAQKHCAEQVLSLHALTIPVLAVTKDARHKAHTLHGESSLIRDHREDVFALNAEVHRFAVAYHRKLRGRMLK